MYVPLFTFAAPFPDVFAGEDADALMIVPYRVGPQGQASLDAGPWGKWLVVADRAGPRVTR